MRLLIANGRVVDPASRTDGLLDVLIEDGRIAAVGTRLSAGDAAKIDASGLVVAPGFIDMHVHLREPGQEHKETIETGTRAAAAGGFTAVCAMPNTRPVNDRPSTTRDLLERAARRAAVHVYPIAALTLGQEGGELTDMAGLLEAGATAFSDDGKCIQNARIMRRAMKHAKALGVLITDHCEDAALAAGGIIHEGRTAARLGLSGIPASAEEVMVARDIILAEELETRIHIAHVSTRGTVRLVREAKTRGVAVTAEVTPHHLLLTEEALVTHDPRFKMNPPLREAADVAALRAAVKDGTIDVFVTDHAPHAETEKAAGLEAAPFGVVGLETAVGLLLDALVLPGGLSLDQFVAMWSTRPASLLGLKSKGRLAPGADADVTVLDLGREAVVDASAFRSKSRNTPFDGRRMIGTPVLTIAGGRIVHSQVNP